MFKRWLKRVIILGALSSVGLTVQTVNAEDSTIKVGVLQYVEHTALDSAREGFVNRLEDSEYGDRVEFDIQNASGNQTTLQSISEKLARDNDVLYAIGTPAAISLSGLEKESPIFISAVTDPVSAGLVDSLENPGRNVTGTSDEQPLAEQVNLLTQNFPDVKTVGLLYNSSEVNSQIQADEATRLLEDQGLETIEATVVTTNDVAQTLNALIQDIDALFIVTDNTVASAMSLVKDLALDANIPFVGGSKDMVLENGLITYGIDYNKLGEQTADMLIRMLEKNLNVSEMPVENANDVELVINEKNAEKLEIDIDSIQVSSTN